MEPPSVIAHMAPVYVKARDLYKTDEPTEVIMMQLNLDWDDNVLDS
jgi:hypothetical protein